MHLLPTTCWSDGRRHRLPGASYYASIECLEDAALVSAKVCGVFYTAPSEQGAYNWYRTCPVVVECALGPTRLDHTIMPGFLTHQGAPISPLFVSLDSLSWQSLDPDLPTISLPLVRQPSRAYVNSRSHSHQRAARSPPHRCRTGGARSSVLARHMPPRHPRPTRARVAGVPPRAREPPSARP
jgi:hypothetical protein